MQAIITSTSTSTSPSTTLATTGVIAPLMGKSGKSTRAAVLAAEHLSQRDQSVALSIAVHGRNKTMRQTAVSALPALPTIESTIESAQNTRCFATLLPLLSAYYGPAVSSDGSKRACVQTVQSALYKMYNKRVQMADRNKSLDKLDHEIALAELRLALIEELIEKFSI